MSVRVDGSIKDGKGFSREKEPRKWWKWCLLSIILRREKKRRKSIKNYRPWILTLSSLLRTKKKSHTRVWPTASSSFSWCAESLGTISFLSQDRNPEMGIGTLASQRQIWGNNPFIFPRKDFLTYLLSVANLKIQGKGFLIPIGATSGCPVGFSLR